MLKNFRIDALELPSPEEWRVVEELGEFFQIDMIANSEARDVRRFKRGLAPVGGEALLSDFGEGEQFVVGLAGGEALAALLVFGFELDEVGFAFIGVEQAVADASHERGVSDSNNGMRIVRCDLDRGMGTGSSGAADEEGLGEAALGHLLGVEDHLVERGGDESGKTDDVGAPFLGFA